MLRSSRTPCVFPGFLSRRQLKSARSKWLDWTGSMQVPYEPVRLPSSTLAESARSSSLWIRGERYFVTPPTIDAAMTHYRRAAALKRRRWWPYAQRIGERVYRSVIRPSAKALQASRFWQPYHEARLDEAAEMLQRAARRQSYLSSDRLWEQRTEQLSGQVEQLRRMLAA